MSIFAADHASVAATIALVVATGALVAATAALAYITHRVREATTLEASLTGYDLAVRELLDFKRDFGEHLGDDELGRSLSWWLDQDKDASHGCSQKFVLPPPGMSSQQFMVYARGVWVFSFVFTVLDDPGLLLTPFERNALRREIALWLDGVAGFRYLWCRHTHPLAVHNARFRDWVESEVHTGRWVIHENDPDNTDRRERRTPSTGAHIVRGASAVVTGCSALHYGDTGRMRPWVPNEDPTSTT